MLSAGTPASGRGFLRIVVRLGWGAVLALAVTGCTDDATAICARLDECELLPDGYSKGSCERELERESDLESCRNCVEDTSCKDIVEKCRDECLLD
jgi:hypothetical protein